MFLFSAKLYYRLSSAFLTGVLLLAFTVPGQAQKQRTKSAAAKKPAASSAKKDTKNSASKSKNASSAKKDTSKKSSKSEPVKNESRASLQKKAADKKKADEIAAKKRAAALEEKKKRDQAAREARARKLAFENSFRTETARNIANDDVTGEDSEIRRAAVNALGARAGTVVVMEAQTGKILTIVNQDWAIKKSFKPCSTIKLVTAVAGLDKALIEDDGSIKDKKFKLDLTDALAYSNNSYFQLVGANLGSDTMISYAKRLGLGQPTGINAEGETSGKLPFGNNNARIYSHGDDYSVTPLQLGVMVSALSNGGKVIVPQIPRSKVQKTSFRGYMRRTIDLPKENIQRVIPGMIGAAEYGTARRGVDADLGIAGKTGSCIEGGSWVGLFASVAPVADPQYAVVVITRGQNERGKYAAAVAGHIYKALEKRMTGGNKNIAKVPLLLKPQPKVNATTSASVDTEKGEDSDDADTIVPKKPAPAKTAAKGKSSPKKTSELFPPVVIKIKNSTTRPRVIQKN
ncbi:MAG: hypothetical protein KIS76_07495 [Pyrinomonadaceae bacterium]|nr:hypothetical protein [Pyrinomonadaceae bacterium]